MSSDTEYGLIRSILVVDDEPTPRKLLASVLRDAGYEVTTVDDGCHVADAFRTADYQLLLTDMRMPIMDGLKVLDWVQHNRSMCLVMLVTGVTETETAVEAMKKGAVDYLTKPFHADAVLLAVQRAAEIYRLRFENQRYRENLEALVEKRTEQINRFADALSEKNKLILHANRQLQEANDKLQQFVNQAMITDKVTTVGILSSMLIHGIANPLGVIGGIIEVMEKRFKDDAVTAKEAAMMREYLTRVLDLVNQIRSYVKMDILQFEKFDVRKAVHDTVALFRLLKTSGDVRVDVDLPETPVVITGNRSQIEQVLVNLVQNAFDSIETQGRISVKAESSNGTALIKVSDNGCGIPPEHQQKLFKMFFTTKKNNRGTGLGLFISHEIAAQHNGTINIHSSPDSGTVVTLAFPSA